MSQGKSFDTFWTPVEPNGPLSIGAKIIQIKADDYLSDEEFMLDGDCPVPSEYTGMSEACQEALGTTIHMILEEQASLPSNEGFLPDASVGETVLSTCDPTNPADAKVIAAFERYLIILVEADGNPMEFEHIRRRNLQNILEPGQLESGICPTNPIFSKFAYHGVDCRRAAIVELDDFKFMNSFIRRVMMEGERRSYEERMGDYAHMMRGMDVEPIGPPIQGARENCAYRQVYKNLMENPSAIPRRFWNSRIEPRHYPRYNMAEGNNLLFD